MVDDEKEYKIFENFQISKFLLTKFHVSEHIIAGQNTPQPLLKRLNIYFFITLSALLRELGSLC